MAGKNPNPVFTKKEKDPAVLPKLMAKAEGFTSRFDFPFMWRFCVRWEAAGCHHCCAGVQLTRLQAMCFHYDPLANRVQRSITNMAIECGLATESRSGNLSVSRAIGR
jgi:incFII family plasmid replication initiator RepA